MDSFATGLFFFSLLLLQLPLFCTPTEEVVFAFISIISALCRVKEPEEVLPSRLDLLLLVRRSVAMVL